MGLEPRDRSLSTLLAARSPPQIGPFRFFSFSYSAMSGARPWSLLMALSFALRLPVEEGVSFSLPALTRRFAAGVVTSADGVPVDFFLRFWRGAFIVSGLAAS